MWSDRDTVDDCLGFSQYVKSLADVCLEQGIAPLTLGIFGSWDSGKTSLMKMLQKAVEADAAAGVKDDLVQRLAL
jgi:ABC-type polysaccharide/polyol phosphate transport system ATPase subunit